jgi:hypothetical protein
MLLQNTGEFWLAYEGNIQSTDGGCYSVGERAGVVKLRGHREIRFRAKEKEFSVTDQAVMFCLLQQLINVYEDTRTLKLASKYNVKQKDIRQKLEKEIPNSWLWRSRRSWPSPVRTAKKPSRTKKR